MSQVDTPTQAAQEQQTLLDWTLRHAPQNVIYNTLYACGAGALYGSTTGVVRNLPAIPAAATTVINTGLFAFSFFTIKEYFANPLLVSTGIDPAPWERQNVHTHHLLSTGLSAFTAGSIFSYIARGPKRFLQAGLTLSLACTAVQGALNEFSHFRLESLARYEREHSSTAAPVSSPTTATSASVAPANNTLTALEPTAPLNEKPFELARETFSERSDRLIGSSWSWFKSKLGAVSPVHTIDDAAYEKTLKDELARIEKEKREIALESERLLKKLG